MRPENVELGQTANRWPRAACKPFIISRQTRPNGQSLAVCQKESRIGKSQTAISPSPREPFLNSVEIIGQKARHSCLWLPRLSGPTGHMALEKPFGEEARRKVSRMSAETADTSFIGQRRRHRGFSMKTGDCTSIGVTLVRAGSPLDPLPPIESNSGAMREQADRGRRPRTRGSAYQRCFSRGCFSSGVRATPCPHASIATGALQGASDRPTGTGNPDTRRRSVQCCAKSISPLERETLPHVGSRHEERGASISRIRAGE